MIKDAIGETRPEPDSYFTNYEATEGDLEALRCGIDAIVESKLIDQEVLDKMTFITFDSRFLEEKFPDFNERKAFVRSVLAPQSS